VELYAYAYVYAYAYAYVYAYASAMAFVMASRFGMGGRQDQSEWEIPRWARLFVVLVGIINNALL